MLTYTSYLAQRERYADMARQIERDRLARSAIHASTVNTRQDQSGRIVSSECATRQVAICTGCC